ncbi:MAG: BPL-N domain-containing protein [bacterium]|nr:BPL-N domain-containing protein [bacterium]
MDKSGLMLTVSFAIFGFMASHVEGKSSIIKVAIYADEGTLAKCVKKSLDIVRRENDMVIAPIKQTDIVNGNLAEYDVLLLPGGSGSGQAESLKPEGRQAIIKFIANGKGIVAICAGGYLVAKGWNENTRDIELINAELYDLDNWDRGVQTITCHSASDGRKEHFEFQIHFENGPIFVPANDPYLPNYVSLATFQTDMHKAGAPANMMFGKDAIIASYFGKGKLVAFSPHPELTPGLEPMLVRAIRWVAKPVKNQNEPITFQSVFGNDIFKQ